MPMELQTGTAPVALKDKILAFYEEASMITGVAVGSMIGGKVMMYHQAMGMEAPGPLLDGASKAVMVGLIIGKIAPMAVNYLANRSSLGKHYVQASAYEHWEKACTPHKHATSQLYGIAAGTAISIGLAATFNLLNVMNLPITRSVMNKFSPQTAQTYIEPPSENIILLTNNYSIYGGGAPIFVPKN